jgi:hypothetical protein
MNIQATSIGILLVLCALSALASMSMIRAVDVSFAPTERRSLGGRVLVFGLRAGALLACPVVLSVIVELLSPSRTALGHNNMADLAIAQFLWTAPSATFYAAILGWPNRSRSVLATVRFAVLTAIALFALAWATASDGLSYLSGLVSQLVVGVLPFSSGLASRGMQIDVGQGVAAWAGYIDIARGVVATVLLCAIYLVAVARTRISSRHA